MTQSQTRLSFGQKAGWGLADMGIVVFVIVKQLLVMAFLTTYLGVPVQVAGAVTTLVLIFDMVTDPLIGYLSDRTNTRWGRRAPWMALGAVVLAGGTIGLFGVPLGLSTPGNLLWVTAFFVLATVGFTMVGPLVIEQSRFLPPLQIGHIDRAIHCNRNRRFGRGPK